MCICNFWNQLLSSTSFKPAKITPVEFSYYRNIIAMLWEVKMGFKRNLLLCFSYTLCVPPCPSSVVIMLFSIRKIWMCGLHFIYIVIYSKSYFPGSFFKTSLSFLGCKNLCIASMLYSLLLFWQQYNVTIASIKD